MAVLTNINPPAVKPAAGPLTNAIAAAADQFAAQFGARYLLRFTNGSAVAANIVLNDPVSQNPGDATQFDPDVTVAMPGTAGAVRTMYVDAHRFRDSSGNISWTYSASMVNAASLLEIYGPL
jgi:hypothetical protein